MAQGKKTFIFYSDWINMVREMPNKDAGELLKHILSYVNDENPKTENLFVKMAFGHMKPLIKSDLIKWEGIRETRRKAGAKGGKANAKQKQANAKQVEAVNVNVNDNVNDNVSTKVDINSRKINFSKSIIKLVNEYFKDTPQEVVKDFCEYWTEHGERDKKMRFEKQKSFDKKLRFNRWLKNLNKWQKEKSSAQKEKVLTLAEKMKQDYGIK